MPYLNITVKTGKKETKILHQEENNLIITLHAQPKNNEANKELLKFLEKTYHKKATIITGMTAKKKLVQLS
ncbi:MAG TPA: DUF167 domain-containing protein [Candidatus Nanoarchaeia archaeon]|nr:DUF167 domain-containing protein [Candidatus Nanoarchaeia archaeon]